MEFDNEQLNQLLQFMMDSLQNASDFASTQAPILFQELVAYLFYTNLCAAITFAVLGIITAVLSSIILRSNKYVWINDRTQNFGGKCIGIILLGLSFIFIPISLNYTIETIKVGVAPRIMCTEWVMEKLNGNNH